VQRIAGCLSTPSNETTTGYSTPMTGWNTSELLVTISGGGSDGAKSRLSGPMGKN
jgi:hypothetical protein